jgi:hypothetical protein
MSQPRYIFSFLHIKSYCFCFPLLTCTILIRLIQISFTYIIFLYDIDQRTDWFTHACFYQWRSTNRKKKDYSIHLYMYMTAQSFQKSSFTTAGNTILKDKGNCIEIALLLRLNVLFSIYINCSRVYTQTLLYNTYILMKIQGIIN